MKYNIGDIVVYYDTVDKQYNFGIILQVTQFDLMPDDPLNISNGQILYKILNQKNPHRKAYYSEWNVYPYTMYDELVESRGIMNNKSGK